MKKIIKKLFIFNIFFFAASLNAESIDIFDQNRGESKDLSTKPIKIQKSIPSKRRGLNSKKLPDFQLIGISRFNNKYTLYFTNKKRKIEQYAWFDNNTTENKKFIYANYSIDRIFERKLYLNINGNKKCIENEAKGVSCDHSKKQMILLIVHNKNTYIRKKPAVKKRTSRTVNNTPPRSKTLLLE